MCGIAGILTREANGDEFRRVEAMQQALRHRGPDDRGLWQSPSQRATFANTRLSILDPTPAGHQPMSRAQGRFTITFNGAIYNFRELRCLLERKGVIFETHADTEVVLRAYEVLGSSCVGHLRGMYAFAIWDEQERTCMLARDRFGIKPLYFQSAGGRLVFASEVKALLRSGAVPRDVDGQALYEYFRAGSVQEPRTLLRSVRTVEAAHVLTWADGNIQQRRYWDFSFASDAVADPSDVAHNALRDSVEHHFVSDVPVGVFLSGGLDSTSIVALANVNGREHLQTFTIGIEGSPDNESSRAARTAAHFRACHHEYRVNAGVARQLFDRFLAVMDQPSIDGLNVFAASHFAAERGMKVMLSGLGADELFGGYPSFTDVPRLTRWRQMLGKGAAARACARALSSSGDPRYRRMADVLWQPPGLTASYAAYRGIFSRAEAAALCRHYSIGVDVDDEVGREPDGPAAEDGVCRLELERYLRNQLLRDGDVMSMACGVELRTPFLDHVLIDTIGRIPAAQRLRAGKQLLIDSVRNWPDGILHRRKRCFQFPFGSWLHGEWQSTFAAMERVGDVPTVTWYRKWCVFVLQHWLTTTTSGEPA